MAAWIKYLSRCMYRYHPTCTLTPAYPLTSVWPRRSDPECHALLCKKLRWNQGCVCYVLFRSGQVARSRCCQGAWGGWAGLGPGETIGRGKVLTQTGDLVYWLNHISTVVNIFIPTWILPRKHRAHHAFYLKLPVIKIYKDCISQSLYTAFAEQDLQYLQSHDILHPLEISFCQI